MQERKKPDYNTESLCGILLFVSVLLTVIVLLPVFMVLAVVSFTSGKVMQGVGALGAILLSLWSLWFVKSISSQTNRKL